MKYKLIKEYPGSPELGTVVDGVFKYNRISYLYLPNNITGTVSVLSSHVENNPEYWEKINENIWWVVFTKNNIQDDQEYFSAWTAHKIECIYAPWEENRKFFKTKEEADDYILHSKPCLSYGDIMWNFKEDTKKNNVSIDIEELIALIKSKI